MRKFLALGLILGGLLTASLGPLVGSAGASLGNPRTGYLTSDVTVSTDGTWADGPTVTLSSATWVVSGAVYEDGGTECQLWDGTTVIASGLLPNSGTITLTGYIVETARATLKISCRYGGTLRASADTGLVNSSYVTAVKAG